MSNDTPRSGIHDNWQSAVEYNKRRRQSGAFHDQHISQLVEFLQRTQGLGPDDIDGKFGPTTLKVLEQAVEGWMPEEPPEVVDPFANWVYPMPILVVEGVEIVPDISSSFGKDGQGNTGRKNHWGVDVMYRRHDNDGGPQIRYPEGHRYAGMRKAQSPTHSPRWYCPHGIECIAVGDGTVWSANWGSNNNIKIDHHNVPGFGPLCTWYQHLHDMFVKPGDEVRAGDVIGIVGAGSSDLIHLHFEWRDYNRGSGRAAAVVDPAPFIKPFKKLTF